MLTAWGCVAPLQPLGRTAALVTVADGADFERLWEAGTRVLRKNRFQPTRQDRAAGVIQTRPSTTQSWFEFWRRDAADAYSFAEANLHTIRRTASIKMDRSQDSENYIISVRVDKERFSAPERQVTSAAGAIQMFGSQLPTRQGRLIGAAEARSWVSLGRDGPLESRLLAQIIRKYRPAHYEYVEVIDVQPEEPAGAESTAEQGTTPFATTD